LKNLSDSNIDVGVDAVESREAADIGQPAGRAHLDFPGFGRLGRRLFSDGFLFGCTSPSRDESKKENCYYAQLKRDIHIQDKRTNTRPLTLSENFRRRQRAV